MGETEIEEIFSEQPQITVRCEFCNTGYEVTQADIEQHSQQLKLSYVAVRWAPGSSVNRPLTSVNAA